jgi:hypothetical protein
LRGCSRLYRSAQRSEPNVRLSASADRRRFAVALTPATLYDYYYCNHIFAIPRKNQSFYAATARIDVILERILNVYSTTLSIFTRSSKETLCFALIAISRVPDGAPFCENCGVQFKAAPVAKKRSSGGGARGGRSGGGAAPPSYLVLSILATMLCCLPTGIVAIINSAKVGGAVARGDYNEARDASAAAMKWRVISFVLFALQMALSWIMIVMKAEAGGGAGM